METRSDVFLREVRENLTSGVLPYWLNLKDPRGGFYGEVTSDGTVLYDAPRGVIHCFTGSPSFARRLLDRNFYVSISGIVTFRAAENVRESARVVPDDRLLVETDSPFLAPVPMRGNENEPAFIVHTVKFLAALRGVPAEELAARTFANAVSLFG